MILNFQQANEPFRAEMLDKWCDASDIYIYMLYSFFMNHMNRSKLYNYFVFKAATFFHWNLTSTWPFFGLRLGGAHRGVHPNTTQDHEELQRDSEEWFLPMWSLVDSMFVRKTYWISHIITITAQVYLMEHIFVSKDHLWSLCSTICQSRTSCVYCKHMSVYMYCIATLWVQCDDVHIFWYWLLTWPFIDRCTGTDVT